MNYWIDTNLTFEYELAERPFDAISRFTQPWNNLLRLLENFEEATVLRPDSEVHQHDKIAIWGVLDRHRDLNIADLPSSEVVETANSKTWCFENRPKVLPNASIIAKNISKDHLRTAISSMKKWIVKDPFGVAGRERFNGDTSTDIEHLLNWMKKSGRSELLLEPYIDIQFESSLHYELKRNAIQYLGSSALICDKNGVFRGNYTIPESFNETLHQMKTTQRPILEKLVKMGYRGPLSIDTFVGKYEGGEYLQSLSEINARYTFGRMFLELQRKLERDDFLWWHPSPKVFKNISNACIESKIAFPLDWMNDTNTLLLSPVQKALKDIKRHT